MKKTLVSALTTALVVGAASTTFAAGNPFTDVPADHWAYDAVTQLANDGIIEGMGDGTYQGARSITRYEMAQMVAKALARQGEMNAKDKALLDKLSAEFSDELNNLGVRVSALEQKVDNVKWTGKVEYTYTKSKHDSIDDESENTFMFRLEPEATVNDHWKVKARIEATTDLSESTNTDDITLDRAWAEGTYGNTVLRFGKVGYITTFDDGIIFDDSVSGGQVEFGKDLKAILTVGQIANDATDVYGENGFLGTNGFVSKYAAAQGIDGFGYDGSGSSTLRSIELAYAPESSKLSGGLGFFSLSNGSYGSDDLDADFDTDNIWAVSLNYNFDGNVSLGAFYAKASEDFSDRIGGQFDDDIDKAYSFQLGYKGAEQEDVGSWGAFVAYRYLGNMATVNTTLDDAIMTGQKGWEIGADYTIFKNMVAELKYFRGSDLNVGEDDGASKFFGRVNFYF